MSIKILHLDIETAPNTAYVWGLFNQNIPIQRLIETGRVMCFAAKWHNKRGILFHSEWDDGHEGMIKKLHELLNEADVAVHYNGNKFDIPTINGEFVYYGMTPPSPYKNVDLYHTVRRNFRWPSRKLDYVTQRLGLGAKTGHSGFELWVRCMKGDTPAQNLMERYNRQDVNLLEKLYTKLLPWIPNHPNHALWMKTGKPVCPNCGSRKLQKRGIKRTKTLKYQQYHCQGCGKWPRSRLTISTPEDKEHVLVG